MKLNSSVQFNDSKFSQNYLKFRKFMVLFWKFLERRIIHGGNLTEKVSHLEYFDQENFYLVFILLIFLASYCSASFELPGLCN